MREHGEDVLEALALGQGDMLKRYGSRFGSLSRFGSFQKRGGIQDTCGVSCRVRFIPLMLALGLCYGFVNCIGSNLCFFQGRVSAKLKTRSLIGIRSAYSKRVRLPRPLIPLDNVCSLIHDAPQWPLSMTLCFWGYCEFQAPLLVSASRATLRDKRYLTFWTHSFSAHRLSLPSISMSCQSYQQPSGAPLYCAI